MSMGRWFQSAVHVLYPIRLGICPFKSNRFMLYLEFDRNFFGRWKHLAWCWTKPYGANSFIIIAFASSITVKMSFGAFSSFTMCRTTLSMDSQCGHSLFGLF